MPDFRMGDDYQAVTISGINSDGKIMYRDPLGIEKEIAGNVRPKAGAPAAGEQWLLVRYGNVWLPLVQIGAPPPVEVTGSRNGMSQQLQQILTALAQTGIVKDSTTDATLSAIDDDPDPVVDPDDPEEPSYPAYGEPGYDAAEDDPSSVEGFDLNFDSGTADFYTGTDAGMEIPAPAIHSPTSTPVGSGVGNAGVATELITTFNVHRNRSDGPIMRDLATIGRTSPTSVLLVQEFFGGRPALIAGMVARGWGHSNTDNGDIPNPIFWRPEVWTKISADRETMINTVGPGDPKRYMHWVRLRHRVLNTDVIFVSVHMTHQGTTYGRPRPGMGFRLVRLQEELRFLKHRLPELQKIAPVIMGGDFNCDYEGDSIYQIPSFPYAMMRSIGFKANWQILGEAKFPHGTCKGRMYDYIWRGPAPAWQIKYISQKIWRNLGSDHDAVSVKMQIRAR